MRAAGEDAEGELVRSQWASHELSSPFPAVFGFLDFFAGDREGEPFCAESILQYHNDSVLNFLPYAFTIQAEFGLIYEESSLCDKGKVEPCSPLRFAFDFPLALFVAFPSSDKWPNSETI